MRLFYTALFVLFCTHAKSQTIPDSIGAPAQNDYQLFRPGVQYLYENPAFQGSPTLISTQYYGVKVDALDRQALYGSLAPDEECIRRVPSPFGYEIAQYADSTVMYFGEDSLVLYQTAPVSTRWLARRDSTGTETFAQVLSVEFAEVLGQPDTLKTIAFYGANDDIPTDVPAVISQRYGMVSGPRFYQPAEATAPLEVAGMSQPRVGVQLPAATDYASVAVGNIFHLETVRLGYDASRFGSDDYFVNDFTTNEIVSVDTVTEHYTVFTYRQDRLRYATDFDYTNPRDSSILRDTLIQTRVYILPTELATLQPGARTADTLYPSLVLLYDTDCELLINRLSPEVVFTDELCGYNGAEVDAGPGPAYSAYVPFTLDRLDTQRGPVIDELLYLETADRSCGTPLDLSDITISVNDRFDPAFDRAFQVYPNPAGEALYLQLPGQDARYEVHLYTMAGTRVQSKSAKSNTRQSLNTATLPTGPYFLLVFEGGRPVARRRVIVK